MHGDEEEEEEEKGGAKGAVNTQCSTLSLPLPLQWFLATCAPFCGGASSAQGGGVRRRRSGALNARASRVAVEFTSAFFGAQHEGREKVNFLAAPRAPNTHAERER